MSNNLHYRYLPLNLHNNTKLYVVDSRKIEPKGSMAIEHCPNRNSLDVNSHHKRKLHMFVKVQSSVLFKN